MADKTTETAPDLNKRMALLEEALETERAANKKARSEIATLKNVDPRSEIQAVRRYCNACGEDIPEGRDRCRQHKADTVVKEGFDPLLRRTIVLR